MAAGRIYGPSRGGLRAGVESGFALKKQWCLHVFIKNRKKSICFSVKDEGAGFDFSNLPDPTAPENLLKENGRGIFLMKNLADKVEFIGGGNEVSLFFTK